MNPLSGLTDYTDRSVGDALAPYLDDLAYTVGLGWMAWDGRVWSRDVEALECKRVLRAVLERFVVPLMATLPARDARALLPLFNGRRQEALLDYLKVALEVGVDEWDSQPWLLNTPDGHVDLRDGSLTAPDKALRATRTTAVPYVAGTTHADWEKAVQCLPEPDTRRWLQAHLGAGCWGEPRSDTLALLTGNGANGKSTITSAVVAALGTYAAPVDRSVIVGKGHEEHKAALRGLRFGLVEELADGHHLNMAEVKALVGTREVVGRHLYKPSMRFRMQATLTVTTNYKPNVADSDHGTWRRLARVEFPIRYEGSDLDPGLRERCSTDPAVLQAVLAWLVEGAAMPAQPFTPSMEERQKEWREEADTLAAFIVDACKQDGVTFTSRQVLYQVFVEWAESQGLKQWSQRTFTQRWQAHPYVEAMRINPHIRAGKRGWLGLAIVDEYLRPDLPF